MVHGGPAGVLPIRGRFQGGIQPMKQETFKNLDLEKQVELYKRLGDHDVI